MGQLKWAALAALAFALLTFVGAYVFRVALGEVADSGAADSGMTLTRDAPNEPEKAPPDGEAAKRVRPEAKGPPAARRDPLFVKRMTLPQENGGADKDHYAHALYLDPTGTRLIAVSQPNAFCLDIPSGKVLQQFHNELPTNNPRPQYITASPDARVVIIPSADGKEVAVREAATGRTIGTAHLNDTSKFYKYLLESRLPAVTPAGDYLLLGAGIVTPAALHAVSTKTGAEKQVDLPRVDLAKEDYKYLLPIPQSSTFIVYGMPRVDRKNPSNLFAVDFTTGAETPLSCLHGGPHFNDWRPMVLSADGRLLLVKGLASVEVCDWRANRLLLHYEEKVAHFDHACFTPDGQRVAFIGRANGVIELETDLQTGKTTSHRIDDVIQLFDIARQEKIASFSPHSVGLGSLVRALAVSHDGKSLAVWTGNEVTLVDFQSAFGVAPLPPSQRLQGPESLPLKAVTPKKDPPRKPK